MSAELPGSRFRHRGAVDLASRSAASDTDAMNETAASEQAPPYDFWLAEPNWQRARDERGCFAVANVSADGKPGYCVHDMVRHHRDMKDKGHVRNYNVMPRYKLASGFSVLHPMVWDGFGLPVENAARECGIHSAKWTLEHITNMRTELQGMRLSLHWRGELATCDSAGSGEEAGRQHSCW
jgi:leucyl-tRNA synthetase